MFSANRRSWPVGLLVVTLLVVVVGCGSGLRTYPVKGKVVMKNGSPVSRGRVSFEAIDGSLSASGRLDRNGCFELSTQKSGDGVPVGNYRVIVVPPAYPGLEASPPPTFAPRYQRYETSGLECMVKKGDNYFEIALDPAG